MINVDYSCYPAYSCCDVSHYIWVDFMMPNVDTSQYTIDAEDCYIEVNIGNSTDIYPRLKTYRLSLTSPEYYYDPDFKIFKPLKKYIIKCINDNYREGIYYINRISGVEVIDPEIEIPDYSVLETQDDFILKQYLNFILYKLDLNIPEKLIGFEETCDFYIVENYDAIIYYTFISGLIKGVEDEFYIRVGLGENGKDLYDKFCRISLSEPKYIYDSNKLPEDGKDAIIKAIFESYNRGIRSINRDMDKIVIDPYRPIPDYWKL